MNILLTNDDGIDSLGLKKLEFILSKYGNVHRIKMYEDGGIRHKFDFDHKHQHFMCGVCHKVNERELVSAERNIVDNLLKFVTLFKTDVDKIHNNDYHSILRNLQGHYPGMYRALEKEWYAAKKDCVYEED